MSCKKTFEKGSVIFEENSWELAMYDIVSGKVGIYANYGKENELLLTELGEGRCFGEMAVIDGMPRSATAVALEDTEVEVIDGKGFEEFLNNNPEKVIEIFGNLAKRLRELSAEYVDACEIVSEYIKDDKKKNGLLAKIKKLIVISEEYSDLLSKSYQDYMYPSDLNLFNTYFLI